MVEVDVVVACPDGKVRMETFTVPSSLADLRTAVGGWLLQLGFRGVSFRLEHVFQRGPDTPLRTVCITQDRHLERLLGIEPLPEVSVVLQRAREPGNVVAGKATASMAENPTLQQALMRGFRKRSASFLGE